MGKANPAAAAVAEVLRKDLRVHVFIFFLLI
jgi:hypothetical protein